MALAGAWTGGVAAFALPAGLAQAFAGMTVALAVFALVAYAAKLMRRPAVLGQELAILPGHAGVAAGVLVVHLGAALAAGAGAAAAGRMVLVAGLALQAALVVALLLALRRAPPGQRRPTPVWQLHAAGLAVAAQVAAMLGWRGLALALLWPAAIAALAIGAAGVRQLLTERIPAPLRVLLVLHLAPLAGLACAALASGRIAAGTALAWAALALLLILAARARWLLGAGFAPLWGVLSLPVASTAWAWVLLWRAAPSELHRLLAGLLLVAATLIVVPLLALIWRDWMRGRLAIRTNAAIA